MQTLIISLLAAAQLATTPHHSEGQKAEYQQHQRVAPRAVQQRFHRDYPEATDTRWNYSQGRWNADFTDHSRYDRGEMVAHYDHTGRHVDSHIPYDRNDVPDPVIRHVEKRYPGSKDQYYTRIERPGSKALFQITMNFKGRHTTRYVDDEGRERTYSGVH